jgi:fibronectin-binding autotransporter adhesin
MKSIPVRFRVLSSSAAALVAALVCQPSAARAGTFNYITGTVTEDFNLLGQGITTDTLKGLTAGVESPWTIGTYAHGAQLTSAVATTQAVVVSAGNIVVGAGNLLFNNGSATGANVADRALGTGNTGFDEGIDLTMKNAANRGLGGVTVKWDTEWWRGGGTATSNDFGYQLLFSTDGLTWTDLGSPTVQLATAANAVLDGNVAANRTTTTFTTLLPANVAIGGSMYFRWHDGNDPDGPDANTAIDNLSFTAFANLTYNPAHAVGGAPNGVLTTAGGDYWLNAGAAAAFQAGDAITFDAPVDATINVATDIVSPFITFKHASGTYTFSGTGKMTGALVKTGAGNIALSNTNTFTSSSLGGGGTVTVNAANALATTGGLATTAGGVTLVLNADATVFNGLDGTGLLTKTGPGTLTLTGTAAGTATGGLLIQAGKVVVKTSASLGFSGTTTALSQKTQIGNNSTLAWEIGVDSNPANRTFDILAGGATLSSNLAAQGNAVIISAANSVIGSATDAITKTGVGVFRFTAAQPGLASPWIINQGTIETTVANGFGTGSITVNSGGLVVVNGAAATVVGNNITLNGGALGVRSGDLGVFGTPTSTITVAANSGLSVRSNSTQTAGQIYNVAAIVSGSAGLTVTGSQTAAASGTVIFQNTANTYSGLLTIGARQIATNAAAGGTGDAFGTAGIALAGGTLSVLDNGSANDGTVAFNHNVSVVASTDTLFPANTAARINVGRQAAGTFTGNTIQIGNLTLGTQPLNVTGANGYALATTTTTLTAAATINNVATTVTLGSIGGAFDLTKTGAGVVNVAGVSTSTGTLIGTAGTLNVTGSISGNATVTNGALNVPGTIGGNVTATASILNVAGAITGSLAIGGGSTLGGIGTISGAVAIGNGVTINPGDALHHGVLHFGNTTFGTTATDLSQINFNVDPVGANRGYVETGDLSVLAGSTVTLNLLNELPGVGIYPIVDYSGPVIDDATFNSFILGPISNPRIIAMLNHNKGSSIIELNITAVDAPRWTGAGNGVWSTQAQTPRNWTLVIGGGTTNYIAGDEVLFDDQATGKTVNLSVEDVAPSKVTFNNSAGNDYTVNGTFGIIGTASLFKTGTGALTINTVNSFSGPVNLSGGGTINFNSIANTGGSSALGAGSAVNVDGGTLNYSGPVASTNRTLTVGANGATLGQNGSGDLTISGNVLGGAFTKTGAGKLILTGTGNTLSGLTISSGTVQFGDGTANASIPGTTAILNNGALAFNHSNALTVNSVISGSGGLSKEGTGSLTLGGTVANTYAGLTTVSAGTLFAGKTNGVNAIGGDLRVVSGGIFRYNGDNAFDQIPDTATVTLDGGTFGDPANTAPLSPSFHDTIGTLVIQNGGIFASGRNVTVAPFTVNGATTVTSGTLLAQRGGTFVTNSLTVEAAGTLNLDGGSTSATQETKVTVGVGGLAVHGGQVVFNSAVSPITTASVGSILLLNGDVTTTGVVNMARKTSDVAVKANIDLGGSASRIFNVTGELNIGNTVTPILPVVIVNGGFEKTGPGIMRLNANGTYAGGTTISGGTLSVGQTGAGTGTITLNGGTLSYDNAAAFTAVNVLAGSGSVIKNGAGAMTINGTVANTNIGLTTIAAGTIFAGKTNGVNSIGGDLLVAAGATFRYFNDTTTNTSFDQIADNATVTLDGGTFGDPVNVNPSNPSFHDTIGKLVIQNNGIFASGRNIAVAPFTVTGATNVTSGTLLVQRAGSFVSDDLTIDAAGALKLDGGATTANQESRAAIGIGGLKLNAGVVSFNSGTSAITTGSRGSILALNGDVTSTGASRFENLTAVTQPVANVNLGGNRTFNVTDTLTIGSATNRVNLVAGGLIKTGPGTLALASANDYAGPTDIQEGTLALTGSITGSSNITVRPNATLDASANGLSVGAAQVLSGGGHLAGNVLIDGFLVPGTPDTLFDIGHLTSANSVTLGAASTSAMELTKSGGVLDSDRLTLGAGATMTYGGLLRVTFTGDTLTLNDTFLLFNAENYAGSFTFDLQDPGNGLYWNTDNLSINGTISAVPEPTGCLLLLGGLGLLAARRRRES